MDKKDMNDMNVLMQEAATVRMEAEGWIDRARRASRAGNSEKAVLCITMADGLIRFHQFLTDAVCRIANN